MEARERTARRCGVASLVLGVLSLGAWLAWQASLVDLGSDLGIDGKPFRVGFFLGSWGLAGLAVLASAAAFLGTRRLGLALPGALTAGMTVVAHLVGS